MATTTFIYFHQTLSPVHPLCEKNEKPGCDYHDWFTFCHTKTKSLFCFQGQSRVAIVKIDKSVCKKKKKTFNKAKEI